MAVGGELAAGCLVTATMVAAYGDADEGRLLQKGKTKIRGCREVCREQSRKS